MGSLSPWHLIILVLLAVLYGYPVMRIVQKAGFSGWWVLIAFVPLVNFLAFWAFALAKWPVERRAANSAEKFS